MFRLIRGRLGRCLLLFLSCYAIFLLRFLHTMDSNTDEKTTTTSPLPHAKKRDIDKQQKVPVPIIHHVFEKNLSSLEPYMTENILGNYEPKNLVKKPGPGEDGAGVQLNDDAEKVRGEKSVADYGFNEVASEKISLDRRARDTR